MRPSIEWAHNQLATMGYTLKNNVPEIVLDTPWSYVARFNTSSGLIYLKHTPEALALEADITKILRDKFHAPVLEVLAYNTKLACFLTKGAGNPLRETLKHKFDAALLSKAIEQFTSMQRSVANSVDSFFDLGVPDWRLERIPDLHAQLLSQENILLADGLSESEIIKLKECAPMVSNWCKELSGYAIKQTLVQCDFHDNNILIEDKTQRLTFIDLGELVISHPFFSLTGFLWQTRKHHKLKEQDARYRQLLNRALSCYLSNQSEQRLLEAFQLAGSLWPVYEALCQYRLRMACDEVSFLSFQQKGKLCATLRLLISMGV